MPLLLASLLVFLLTGVTALAIGSPRRSSRVAAWGAAAGGLLGLIPAVRVLLGGTPEAISFPWAVPGGSFSLGLDPLSAFFLIPTLLLIALGAVYGNGYLDTRPGSRRLGPHWFFYHLLAAGMVLLLTARNGILFLTAWEVMSLASFFLVTFDDERPEVREAGWTYLVAAHLGTAFLLVLFLLLGRSSGSLDFEHFSNPAGAGALFLLAVVGFGTKAGFAPLHVWLPEAHPAAPSHVSALMSGALIKTGIYGLLRTISFLGTPSPWWGWVLIGIGFLSAVGGILFGLAQGQLKRFLAYSSVENIGIIALGIGTGVLGLAARSQTLAVLGFAGALLHGFNHALMKGLLFMGAGAVVHGAGTGELDRMGGLLKRMPRTGAAFAVGAAAIAALPPLNGFAGEFLIFSGALGTLALLRAPLVVPVGGTWLGPSLTMVLVGLALAGGLAAAAFTRAFGGVFLGEPRSPGAARAHEAGPAMTIPLMVLAAACILLGLAAPLLAGLLGPVVNTVTGIPSRDATEALQRVAVVPLGAVTLVGVILVVLTGLLVLLRRALLSGRTARDAVTWDCGFAAPTPRMEYTASSFAQPLTGLFGQLLGTRELLDPPRGFFPEGSSIATVTPDACREHIFRPLFNGVRMALAPLRGLQHGHLHLYVLYIAATLLVLMAWQMGFTP